MKAGDSTLGRDLQEHMQSVQRGLGLVDCLEGSGKGHQKEESASNPRLRNVTLILRTGNGNQ